MSRDLIDRIVALPNVELHTHTEIVTLHGDRAGGLTATLFRNTGDRTETTCVPRHLFLFIGGDPHTAWLQGCAALDDKGFVLTGAGPGRVDRTTALLIRNNPARHLLGRRRARGLHPARPPA